MMAGNSARKNVKDSAAALVVMDPCHNPLKKKETILYIDIPSNPGITIRLLSLFNTTAGHSIHFKILSTRLFINLLAINFVIAYLL